MSRASQSVLVVLGVGALVVGGACAPRPDQPPTTQRDAAPPIPLLPAEDATPIVAPLEDVRALAEGNNAFALDLYRKLAEKTDGNLLFSPYSIRTALGMTYAGARGQTAEEMAKVLHFTLPPDKLHTAFGATAQQLQSGKAKPYQLSTANALWGQTGYPFRPEFLELTRKNYCGSFQELDMAFDPNVARKFINRWVENRTQNCIKELLQPNDITNQVRLVLTNAIYFKGVWVEPFQNNQTKVDDFESTSGMQLKTEMMHTGGKFLYNSHNEFQLVMLPYQGRVGMIVLLPARRHGLESHQQVLTAEKLTAAILNMRESKGFVTIPKFKASSRLTMTKILSEMGMQSAFSGAADFSALSSDGNLALSQVIHSGNIEMNERGTEAAGATAVTMRTISDDTSKPFQFRADHPFLYFLVDRPTLTILFMGRYSGPG